MTQIISVAKERFDPVEERLLFEEFVFKQFNSQGLDKDWKHPIWLNTKIYKEM